MYLILFTSDVANAISGFDPQLQENPLIADVLSLIAMFPDQDASEIYAYLQAFKDNDDRVQLVIDELLQLQNQFRSVEAGNSNNSSNPASQYHADLDTLTDIFIDCDPEYLVHILVAHIDDPDRLQTVTAELFENRDGYPKLTDRLERAQKEAIRWRLMNPVLELEKFLDMFPDPDAHFGDESQPVSESYKQHAMMQLSNDFRLFKIDFVRSKFKTHKFHFAPTYFDLDKTNGFFKGNIYNCNGQSMYLFFQ